MFLLELVSKIILLVLSNKKVMFEIQSKFILKKILQMFKRLI